MFEGNRMSRFLKKVFFWKSRMPKSGFIEIEKSGFLWRVDLDSYLGRAIAESGIWEPRTTAVIQRIVKPGMNVLDIGANIGYYTLLIAQLIGSHGKIWAFEPVRKYRNQLYWHINHNSFQDRVFVADYGLSDEMIQIPISIGNSSATLYWIDPDPAPHNEIIKLKRLDDEVENLRIKDIDFIKLDIDGNEPKFFRGARKTILKYQPVIALEFAQRNLHIAQSDVREQAKLLKEMGYVLCKEPDLTPYKTEMEFLMECGNFDRSGNAVAIPKNKLDDY